ncbi:MAG: PKD domain-containing protein, partial [Sphingobacteriales bacterium]
YTFAPVADINAVDGVASYLWDFGDGTTSTAATPSHTYTNTGNYNIRLTITTNSGCTATVYYPDGVKTGTPVSVDFTADKFSVCASDGVQFTAIAPGADEYLWDFGDGSTSDLQNPIHIFEDTGFVNIRLTALNNRCPSDLIKPRYIHVDPPIARFSYSVDCDNKLLVNFRDSSIVDPLLGNITYSWTFGGSVPGTSNAQNPSFTFAELGSQKVTLTVTNGPLCSFTYEGEILLTDEKASFTSSKRVVCKDEEFTLTATPPNPANIKFYEWTVGPNLPVLDTSLSFKARLAEGGLYDVMLVIIDTNFCRDTLVAAGYMEVVGPDPDFGPDARGTCPNVLFNFTDKTVSTAPITKWTWEYGDGTVRDYTAPPFNHRYQNTGVFGVRLTVTDNRGCKDSKFIEDTVIVTSPTAGFLADTVFCPGVPLNYTDTSIGRNLTYLWNLGNGATSTDANPTNIFPVGDAQYNVS